MKKGFPFANGYDTLPKRPVSGTNSSKKRYSIQKSNLLPQTYQMVDSLLRWPSVIKILNHLNELPTALWGTHTGRSLAKINNFESKKKKKKKKIKGKT